MMALSHETDFPNIFHSTRGMIFMGTPFRGVPESSDLKTPGAIYDAIAAKDVDYQDSVLLTIAQDNELLTATVAEFARIVGTSPKPPVLFCFYEQRATNIGAIVGIETRKVRCLLTAQTRTWGKANRQVCRPLLPLKCLPHWTGTRRTGCLWTISK
jgi:hypothetical protein